MATLINGEWQPKSGLLKNPGKRFFMELAVQAVKKVNAERDRNGLTFARKAMIRCGLARDVTGEWRVQQLKPELQEVIKTNLDLYLKQADKHPGLLRTKGHIGFQSYNLRVEFRNIFLKAL